MRSQIDLLGQRIALLIERLRAMGYVFEDPKQVFPGPEIETESIIEKIEREVGEIPEALKLFWRQVGSVNLTGHHPSWTETEFCPDQLIVYPASYALYYFEDEYGNRLEYDKPFQIVVAPDELHKANISGGAPYSISIPAVANDPPLNASPVTETFLEHIDRSLKSGGFPGIEGDQNHNWPITKLRC